MQCNCNLETFSITIFLLKTKLALQLIDKLTGKQKTKNSDQGNWRTSNSDFRLAGNEAKQMETEKK